MKLNHDLVRHILLSIESSSNMHGLTPNELLLIADKHKVDSDIICYTLDKLYEGQFITQKPLRGSDEYILSHSGNLTYDGHAYLDNIRDNKIWSETKSKTSKLASVSLDILSKVATNVILKSLDLN